LTTTSKRISALMVMALAGSPHSLLGETLAFALIGDVPYETTAGAPSYVRMIDAINTSYKKVKFTIHAGDIKPGNTLCSDSVYSSNVDYFNRFADASIFLPGDNEWTDCHRANNGSYDPVERLGFLRSTFYTSNLSLGRKPITLSRQAGYPENVMWTAASVIFVGLNMPGSNNNRNRTDGLFQDPTDAEYTARNTANLAWLNAAFDMAAADPTIKGILIVGQANPFERFLEPVSASLAIPYKVSGYADFISTLRTRTIQWGKPVVYVNGDTHYFRIDRPMTGTYPGCTGGQNTIATPCVAIAAPGSPTDRVDNFTRVEVFGQNDVHWVRGFIDTDDPRVFTFAPQTVTGN